jgi:hypothetical protein
MLTLLAVQAINAATLSAAFQRYDELGFVQRRKSEGVKPQPLIALCPGVAPTLLRDGALDPSGSLAALIEHLSAFRREGKDRRDEGGVVPPRLLNVIEKNLGAVVEWTRNADARM